MVFLKLNKSKSGISTIIGGVIIIAIMFTVITPLFFYMNTMNNLYDNITTEMRDLDQQRTWEDVDVLAWAEEGERYIYVGNKGSIAVEISRIWVVADPPHPPFYKSISNLLVKPGETIEINDPDINNHISSLEDTRYYMKISTTRGNIFASSYSTRVFSPGYGHPLVILGSTEVEKTTGSKFLLHLEVINQLGYEFIVDYIVVTGITFTGAPSQIIIDPPIAEPLDWFFPPGAPGEEPPVQTHTTNELDMSPLPNGLKIELIGPDHYIIGAFYFFEPFG